MERVSEHYFIPFIYFRDNDFLHASPLIPKNHFFSGITVDLT